MNEEGATDIPGVSLSTIAREWTRIGVIGFGGPPAHLSLLRRLCVQRRGWMTDAEFEDGIAATNLLPGPASTQMAIYCAWRLRRVPGAIVGGVGFILPGFVAIVALSVLFFARRPPLLVRGAAAGAGGVVAAVALAAASLTCRREPPARREPAPSRSLAGRRTSSRARWPPRSTENSWSSCSSRAERSKSSPAGVVRRGDSAQRVRAVSRSARQSQRPASARSSGKPSKSGRCPTGAGS